MNTVVNVSRRQFLKQTGITSVGLVVATQFMAPLAHAHGHKNESIDEGVFKPNYFVSIEKSGVVTITCSRSEMGQGVRTGMSMIVADELEADWERCEIWQAPGDKDKYDPPGKDGQNTDGSRSTRHGFDPMRELGASARDILERAAAKVWNVPQTDVYAENHQVHLRGKNKTIGYGDLVEIAAGLPVSDNKPVFKDPAKWRYIGKNLSMVDGDNIVSGTAVYGADVILPNMKIAVVARCPVYRGKVKTFDATETLQVAGVEQVIEIPAIADGSPAAFNALGGIAIVGNNTWAVMKGREKLKIEWDLGPHQENDSDEYHAMLMAQVRKDNGQLERNRGDAVSAIGNDDNTVLEAEYFVPFYAHATMEPPVALADATSKPIKLWVPTQNAHAVRQHVSKLLGVELADVECNITLLGGGFGRKSKADYAVEAAFVSSKVNAPVRVQWSREDDIKHGFYHAGSAQRVQAAIGKKDKEVKAWIHDVCSPTISSTFNPSANRVSGGELGLGLSDMIFDSVPNIQIKSHTADAKLRIGWFRSVNNIQHAFALNSFVHEIAQTTGKDTLDLMLALIGDAEQLSLPGENEGMKNYPNYGDSQQDWPIMPIRLANALKVVALKSDYRNKRKSGAAIGLACHRSFQSYVAAAVHVTLDKNKKPTVERVDMAIDCGRYVNPEGVIKQVEGSAVMAHSLAMNGQITTKGGAVEQNNFYDYTVVRADQAPLNIHVHIIDDYTHTKPCGVGEPGVPPYAPALANALQLVTGQFYRKLPITI